VSPVDENDVGKAEVARFWDEEAERFDDEPDHGLADPVMRAAWLALLETVLPTAPARVADLGCGTGTLSELLAQRGYLVDGVDLSERMIGLAERKTVAVDPHPRFHVADAADPPLEAGTFDVVLSRHVLWAMPDATAALRRWIDLLAHGGRLVLVEGYWATGAGLHAADVEALVGPLARVTEVRQLSDRNLWGEDIVDERYLLVAQLHNDR
jgi:SAM-dependent methyltransferase